MGRTDNDCVELAALCKTLLQAKLDGNVAVEQDALARIARMMCKDGFAELPAYYVSDRLSGRAHATEQDHG